MSRIDDLIANLCPNGVQTSLLGSVCDFNRGLWIKADQLQPGDVPVVTSARGTDLFHSQANRFGESVVIASSGAYAGFVSFWSQPIYLSNAFSVDPKDPTAVMTKYLFYCLEQIQPRLFSFARGSGVPNVYGKDLENLAIRIPPLEVQEEIVRILDTFTSLEAELEAELGARKTQYSHYRKQLLKVTLETQTAALGDIGDVKMCKRVLKHQTSTEGEIPFFKIGTLGFRADSYISANLYGELREKYSFPKKGDILISAAGTIGRTVRFNGEDAYFQDSNTVWLEHDEKQINNRFLEHALSQVTWGTTGGTISRLYNAEILRTVIPLPTMEEQLRIVEVLDRFDALVNDMSIGLPAELTARRAQHEYYRERLLTFESAA